MACPPDQKYDDETGCVPEDSLGSLLFESDIMEREDKEEEVDTEEDNGQSKREENNVAAAKAKRPILVNVSSVIMTFILMVNQFYRTTFMREENLTVQLSVATVSLQTYEEKWFKY